jgi:hypothetical protein
MAVKTTTPRRLLACENRPMPDGANRLDHLLADVSTGRSREEWWSHLHNLCFRRETPEESWQALERWAEENRIRVTRGKPVAGRRDDFRVTFSPLRGTFPPVAGR